MRLGHVASAERRPPRGVKVLAADFVTSVPADGALPADTRALVALVGRSNVGKSTLVNKLARRRIARSGATPGTTRLLNVYRFHVSMPGRRAVNMVLVDLPGYGYARGPRETARDFETLTTQFFARMVNTPATGGQIEGAWLAGALLVVDARHPGLVADLAARDWLVDRDCHPLVVATKGDRLSSGDALRRAVRAHEAALEQPVVAVSRGVDGGVVGLLWSRLADMAAGGAA